MASRILMKIQTFSDEYSYFNKNKHSLHILSMYNFLIHISGKIIEMILNST